MKTTFFALVYLTIFSSVSTLPVLNSTGEGELYTIHFEPNKLNEISVEKVENPSMIKVETREQASNYPENSVFISSENTLLSPLSPLNQDVVNATFLRDLVEKIPGTFMKRQEVKINNANFIKHPMIPISACHDNTDGFGGSIGYSGGITAGTSVSLGADLGTMIIEMIDISFGVGVSASVSISESISCSIKEGESGQIFVEPWIINVDYQHRTHYGPDNINLIPSKWESARHNFPISVSPAPFCHTGLANTKCGVAPVSQILVENGANI